MSRALLACVALLSTGCSFNAPIAPSTTSNTTPPSTAPASIRVVASSRADYRTTVVATVLTADGHFVSGIPIGFMTTSGTLSIINGTTDGSGSATTIADTPINATVTATIGMLWNTIQIAGSSAPVTTPTPPTIPPQPPTPSPSSNINAPATGTTGTAVTFGVSSQSLGQTWTWTFGDGLTAQTGAFTTTHIYTKAGTYSVSVGASGITSPPPATITISDPK